MCRNNSYFGKTCEDENRVLDIILDKLDNLVFYIFVEIKDSSKYTI